MNMIVAVLSVLGFLVSLYGYFVEQKFRADPTYKPACDINDQVSCSKAFMSQYGKLFGVTNTIAGMAFYCLVFVLAILGFSQLLFYLTAMGVGASIFFGFLLIFKVQSYCLVCLATYVINGLLFIFTFF